MGYLFLNPISLKISANILLNSEIKSTFALHLREKATKKDLNILFLSSVG